jgi:chromosome segregation ATPase
MATTEKEVLPFFYTWFHSPTAALSFCAHEQRQKVAQQQRDINKNEESIDNLKLKRNELITDLQPHKDYKAAFDTAVIKINREIAIVKAGKCNSFEEEGIKSARIRRMQGQLQLCQEKMNKAGTVAHLKRQEKQLKELDLQISELEQRLPQQKAILSSLQSALTKTEQELERKKPILMALSVKYIKNIFTSLNEQPVATLVR